MTTTSYLPPYHNTVDLIVQAYQPSHSLLLQAQGRYLTAKTSYTLYMYTHWQWLGEITRGKTPKCMPMKAHGYPEQINNRPVGIPRW